IAVFLLYSSLRFLISFYLNLKFSFSKSATKYSCKPLGVMLKSIIFTIFFSLGQIFIHLLCPQFTPLIIYLLLFDYIVISVNSENTPSNIIIRFLKSVNNLTKLRAEAKKHIRR